MKKGLLLDITVVFLLVALSAFLFILLSLYRSRTVYSSDSGEIKDTGYFTASIPKDNYRPHFISHAKDGDFTENVEFRNFVKSHPENFQSYIHLYNKLNVPFCYIDSFKIPAVIIKSDDLTYLYKSSNSTLITLLREKPRLLIKGSIDTIRLYKNNDLIITLNDENFDSGTVKVYIPGDEINTSDIFGKYRSGDCISLEGYVDTDKTNMTNIIFYCTAVSEGGNYN